METTSKHTDVQSRLVTILSFLLLLQTPLLVFLGLNLLTNNWFFLTSWQNFWQAFVSAFQIARETPGEFVKGEALFYNFIAFIFLVFSAGISFAAGLTFSRVKTGVWIMALLAQIGTLITGIGLYIIHRPPHAYWLIVIGVIMVLYLNYREIRHWFLQDEENGAEKPSAEY